MFLLQQPLIAHRHATLSSKTLPCSAEGLDGNQELRCLFSFFLIIFFIPYILRICCMHQILVTSFHFVFITEDAVPSKILSSFPQIKNNNKKKIWGFTSGIWGMGKLTPKFVNSPLLLNINLKSQELDFSEYIARGISELNDTQILIMSFSILCFEGRKYILIDRKT